MKMSSMKLEIVRKLNKGGENELGKLIELAYFDVGSHPGLVYPL